MSVVAGLTLSIGQFVVRSFYMKTLGAIDAGYWQAMVQISTVLASVFTTTLSIYYLPKFSSLVCRKKILNEVKLAYLVFMPLMLVLIIVIWFLRHWIVLILFSHAFLPMQNLFLFQLVGLLFQVMSWIICNLMWAKAMYRIFIVSEVVFLVTYIVFSLLAVKYFGTQGMVMGFCVNYVLYFIFALGLLGYFMKTKKGDVK
jgi:PST family polysaccharide transporter